MSLTSLSFLGVYFPLLLIAYYNPFFTGNGFRKFLLVCASLAFYTFCEPVYIFLLIGVVVLNYGLVSCADRFGRQIFRSAAIVLDAGILLFFKYINRFLAAGIFNAKISDITFPIGMSYFVFKAISYVVDSKKVKNGSLADITLYIANFLTIVAGPLSTYEQELSSIREKSAPSVDLAYKGFERVIIGFGKKVIIADSLSVLANQCFASRELSVVMAWAGAAAYTLQLFFDFSGYTDMVLGAGALFGFEFPENFDCPYMAKSISEFWERWHISLTKWFTKYIYIPLGGSRVKTTARHFLNLFIVWLVTGMWHGSHMTFIVWAMVYFVLQTAEKYTRLAEHINRLHLGHLYVMLVVTVEWVIFKSESLHAGFTYIKSMTACNGNAFCTSYDLSVIVSYSIPFVLGLVFSTDVGIRLKAMLSKYAVTRVLYHAGLLLLFSVCLVITISHGYSAPLYAGF